jgi:hypothetical protein
VVISTKHWLYFLTVVISTCEKWWRRAVYRAQTGAVGRINIR